MSLRLPFLALLTFLCTCGRAQSLVEPDQTTNVAFIKSPTGQLIDRITVRTSTMAEPASFPFPGDTLILDIDIISPMDELTLNAYAGDHDFGSFSCWVDPPTANVHLSVGSGKMRVDSVSLSSIDRWYREQVAELNGLPDFNVQEQALLGYISSTNGTLLSAKFLDAYFTLPTVSRQKASLVKNILEPYFFDVEDHPDFRTSLTKMQLLTSNRSFKFNRYRVVDPVGSPGRPDTSEDGFFVLNIYPQGNPEAELEHKVIQTYRHPDSLLHGIPFVSVAYGNSQALWSLYVRENDFSWPHYREPDTDKQMLTRRLAVFPKSTYLLIDDRGKIQGVFPDLVRLTTYLYLREVIGGTD